MKQIHVILSGLLGLLWAQSWIVNVSALPYSHGSGTTCGKGDNLTASNAPVCGNSAYYGSEDMVWVFTPSTSGQIAITLTHTGFGGAWTGLMLYEGGTLSSSGLTGSTCIAYVQSSATTQTLTASVTAGQTYYLHLDAWGPPTCGIFSNLTISAPSAPLPPVVNVPSLPYSSGPGTTCGQGDKFNSSSVSPICGDPVYYTAEDMMWIFTPTTSGQITIELTSSNSWTGLMLYQGGTYDPSNHTLNGGVCVAFQQNASPNKTLRTCVQAGQTYYLILDQWASPSCGSFTNLSISAPNSNPPTPFFVDIPSLPYAHGAGSTCGMGDNFNPGSLSPICGNQVYYNSEDMLLRFTPATSGQIEIQLLTSGSYTALVLYEGGTFNPTCGVYSGGNCLAHIQNASGSKLLRTCVQAGQTYYLLVDQWGPPYCFSFSDLTISAPNPNPPTPYFIDIPALPYSHGPSTTCGMGNNFDAGSISPICGLGSYYNSEDRLFRFTAPATGPITIQLNSNTTYTGLVLYQGGTFDPVCGRYTGGTCVTANQDADANKTIVANVTAGETYYLLLDQWGPPYCGPYSLLSISAPPLPTPQVVNVASLPYTHGAGSTCSSNNWFTRFNSPVCGDSAYYDGKDIVWRITPTTSGLVTVEYTSNNAQSALMVYEGGTVNTTNGGFSGSTCIAYAQGGNPTKTLTFCVQAGQVYYIHADMAPPPDCENFSNLTISAPVPVSVPVTNVSSLPYTQGAGSTCGQGDSFDEENMPVCGSAAYYAAGSTGEDRLWRFTPTTSGFMRVQARGVTNGSFVIYEGGNISSCGRLVGATCKAVDQGPAADFIHTLCVTASTPYYVLLDTLAGGCITFSGVEFSAPSPVSSPQYGFVNVGSLPYIHRNDSTCGKGDKANAYHLPATCGSSSILNLPDGAEDMIWALSPSSTGPIQVILYGPSRPARVILYRGGLPNPCPPLHTFICEAVGADTLQATLQAGQTYYLMVEPLMPGCLRYDSLLIRQGLTTTFASVNSEWLIYLLPNPVSEALTIHGETTLNDPITFSIGALTGERLLESSFIPSAGRWTQRIGVQGLAAGTYYLKVQQGQHQRILLFQKLP